MSSNVWTETNNPSGQDNASRSDDDIRKVRIDVQERMTELGFDWFADPITQGDSRWHFIHWSNFRVIVNSGLAINELSLANNASTATFQFNCPLPMLRGVEIEEMFIICATTHASCQITGRLLRTSIVAGVVTESAVATITLVGILALGKHGGASLTAGLPHDTDSDPTATKIYSINVGATAPSGNFKFYGVYVKYKPSKINQTI